MIWYDIMFVFLSRCKIYILLGIFLSLWKFRVYSLLYSYFQSLVFYYFYIKNRNLKSRFCVVDSVLLWWKISGMKNIWLFYSILFNKAGVVIQGLLLYELFLEFICCVLGDRVEFICIFFFFWLCGGCGFVMMMGWMDTINGWLG